MNGGVGEWWGGMRLVGWDEWWGGMRMDVVG